MKYRLAKVAPWLIVLLAAGCAAGGPRFQETPAGFWAGLWHGLICLITFIVSLFKEGVNIYEANNAGPLYDLGFVLGALLAFGCGGSCRPCCKKKTPEEQEWDVIGRRVEEKVRKGIRAWLDESGKQDVKWEELGAKIEAKVKRELSTWADS